MTAFSSRLFATLDRQDQINLLSLSVESKACRDATHFACNRQVAPTDTTLKQHKNIAQGNRIKIPHKSVKIA